jgi:hypothetical protein
MSLSACGAIELGTVLCLFAVMLNVSRRHEHRSHLLTYRALPENNLWGVHPSGCHASYSDTRNPSNARCLELPIRELNARHSSVLNRQNDNKYRDRNPDEPLDVTNCCHGNCEILNNAFLLRLEFI